MLEAVVQQTFAAILVRLSEIVGPVAFERWFADVELTAFHRGTMTLAVPNVFVRDWIAENFQDRLVHAATAVLGTSIAIDVVVNPRRFGTSEATSKNSKPRGSKGGDERPRFHDTFVKVPENTFALLAAEHFVEKKEPRLNPLFLVGPPGSGKSRVLKAIARRTSERANGERILEITANAFTSRFSMALKAKTTAEFRSAFEDATIVCFDEVHRLKGRHATQREFLTLLSRLESRGIAIALASRHAPSEIHHLAAPLAALLGRGIVVRLESYSPDSLVKIHKATAIDGTRAFDDSVVETIAKTSGGDVRLFRERLKKLAEYAAFLGESPTLDFAKRHLSTVILENDQSQDIEAWLIDRVCARFEVTREMVVSKKKLRRLTAPRALIICLLRDVLQKTFAHIGVVLGDRTHAAIHLVYKQHAEKVKNGPDAGFFRDLARSAGRTISGAE